MKTVNYNDTDDLILLEHQRYMDMMRSRKDSKGEPDVPPTVARFSMKKKEPAVGLRSFYNAENDIQCISRADIKTETWWMLMTRQLREWFVGLTQTSGRNAAVQSREN